MTKTELAIHLARIMDGYGGVLPVAATAQREPLDMEALLESVHLGWLGTIPSANGRMLLKLTQEGQDAIRPLTPDTAPRGTLARLGHRANRILIVKGSEGWRRIDSGLLVPPDDFRAGWDVVFCPEEP